ncbi:GNAT family N-acetyltransferase [Pseudomonas guariconensis]|uniref:GNAT family N-acetyltransferase n=1 Tax=Pseudomonas TaxID=286 RepID=UPI002096A0E2|nr:MULTISPECIES: GNAT family N-acetyltransferase [Pseudomonas]MCO7643011.1 GNAT family N-acetyltransferase [Pseudomonas sp. S 311-6]MCO7517574.1 GNAT family N-acetyltransferase [Pseudomonas putida]MCO7567656.1 GNAT family N-acetyltransferase [Pseudomonas mosselii]MCO7608030.1 GNAT family N-acetyltransferase [Pseudomonas guariconensis]MCO7619047.1 GNAT family N-acetyltransferase [Pseudomonas guariconensis]
MFILSRPGGVPPESFQNQIRQLVIDHVGELSSVAISPDNPLYPLYQYGVGLEVHQYLQAMDGTRGLAVELTLALDAEAPQRLLGFALSLPAQDNDQACTLAFLAVAASHRRQGIARALLADLQSRYACVELNVFASLVPWFETMGMQVVAANGPQVLMSSTGQASEALVGRLDIAPIYRTLEVRQIHAYLLKQHGQAAMIEAEQQRDARLDALGEQAQDCVRQRKTVH